jgi:glycosyltransferase involved in cell wall biosynthesis
MKKICFILRSHPAVSLGGAELQSLYIAEELARRGWEVHYISEYRGRFPHYRNDNGIVLHWLKVREPGTGFLNFFAFLKLLKQLKPNVIYQRVAVDYTGIVRFLAKSYRIQHVWAASSDKDCQKDKFLGQVTRHKNPLRRLLQYTKFRSCDLLISYGIRGSDIAIVQSEDQRELLLRHFGKNSTVIKNGWPVSSSSEKKTNKPTILWVGNIKLLKRVDLFVELARECQNLSVRFIVIGRDSKDGFLANLLAHRPVNNLEYLGSLDVKQVERYMSSSWGLVNTSDYEGFPNTFIQSWMRRTPVISLNVDPDGVIKKYQLGFHSGAFGQMVADVKTLIENVQLRRQMSKAAHYYAMKEHNMQKKVDLLEKVIKSRILIESGDEYR